jgi:parvulin-like peptidyl-prolyl isomerase
MPTVFEIAFHLHPGGISEVLKSDYGYHLVMLLQHIPKQQLGLEEAEPKISAIIRHQKKEQIYSQWVEKALATIDISTATATW